MERLDTRGRISSGGLVNRIVSHWLKYEALMNRSELWPVVILTGVLWYFLNNYISLLYTLYMEGVKIGRIWTFHFTYLFSTSWCFHPLQNIIIYWKFVLHLSPRWYFTSSCPLLDTKYCLPESFASCPPTASHPWLGLN